MYCIISTKKYCQEQEGIISEGFLIGVYDDILNQLSIIVNDYKFFIIVSLILFKFFFFK